MKILPFYPFYWADYSSETFNLTQGQHGAYILFLRHIYTTGKPVPDKQKFRIAQALLEAEKENAEFVLENFFVRDGDDWRNLLAEKLINYQNELHKKKVEGGRKGGNIRVENLLNSNKDTSSTPSRIPSDNPSSQLQAKPKDSFKDASSNQNQNHIIKKDNTSVLSKEKPTIKLKKLEIPTLEEVKTYASEAKLLCNCDHFFDHFTANGWKQSNKNPIIDWKAALRNWDRNESKFASPDEIKTKQEAVNAITPREESEIGKIHKKIIEEQGMKGYEVDSFKKRFSIMEKREDGLYVIAKHPIEIEVFRNNYRKILNQYSIKVEARYEDVGSRKSLIN